MPDCLSQWSRKSSRRSRGSYKPMATSTAVGTRAFPGGRVRSFVRRLRAGDACAYLVTASAAGTIFLITSLIVYELFVQSGPSRHTFGWDFLLTQTWDPVAGQFGALPFIYGTVVTSALALGATRWQTTSRVVVPYALKGITGSIFLALARALGETMAVTMVIGNTPQISFSLFAPGHSIAAAIANEF